MNWRFLIVFAGGLMLAAFPAIGTAEDRYDGNWHFAVAPYVWVPNFDATMKFATPPGDTEATAESSILDHLNFAAMLAGEARKGNWAVLADVIYLDLENAEGSVKSVTGPGGIVDIPANSHTDTRLTGVLWQLAGSRTVINSRWVSADVLAGVRFLRVEATLNWQISGGLGLLPPTGNFSEDETLWDGIVGVRGRGNFGNWFFPYYLDVGAGSSRLTWQGEGGVGYSFRWGDVLLAYRYLFYEQGNGNLLQNASFGGPLIGAIFRF